MNYAYVRVSSITQNVERQIVEMLKNGVEIENIYIDKQSGKDFNRISYQKLKNKLTQNDVLFIKSIDRLGRNYNMIIDEWRTLTKYICCDVVVIDMPLLDTRNNPKNLIGKFISDIVLQILSFVAETERDFIKTRQREGIDLAKLSGIHMGRPRCILPTNFCDVVQDYNNGIIDIKEALKLTNLPSSTFYKYKKLLG